MSSPRVFGLPHLSEDAVAAYADGVLSASAASRARRHCAECAECAAAVRVQREAAMLLRTTPAPALPSGLLDRLAGLPMSASLPPPCGGLPTVLGADGTPMFVAHDVHQARLAGDRTAGERSADQPADPGRPVHRRGALPVTVLASAAAVVAAGTFGGHVTTLASNNQPAGAAQVSGALAGQSRPDSTDQGDPASRSGTLPAAVLDAELPVAGLRYPVQPIGHRGLPLPVSVTLTPASSSLAAASGVAAPALPTGFGPMVAGAPAATP